MASWLKAAEDLFEVVDRRAKLVVSELSDEQQDGQAPASNGQGSQAKKTKSKPKSKAQKRLLTNKPSKTNDTTQVHTDQQPAVLDIAPDKDRATRSFESDGTPSSNSTVPENNELLQNGNKDASMFGTPSSETLPGGTVKMKVDLPEVVPTVSDVEAVASTSNGELVNDKVDINEGQPTSVSPVAEVEIVSEDYSVDAGQNLKSRDADVTSQIDQDGSQSASVDAPSVSETQSNDADSKVETSSNQKKQQEHKGDASPTKLLEVETSSNQKKQHEHKDDASPMKLQDQLDEAQGLLKTAVSTGQSKEARLTRVCAGLLTRLQECKSENAQLEELLAAEKELSNSYEARIKQLHQDLSASKIEVSKVESSMVEALAAKNSEIEALVNSMDALKKQAVFSEGNMASMQANMESIMRNRELTETRMMQALREELASAERRAEEERAAHHATKMAAMEREVELEHRAVEASTALARIQRVADERTAKAAEFEQKVALLEVECASLNQELQDMEARARRGQKKSPEEANQVIQAWQEEGERARLGQRDAEAKLSSMEAEVQKMRVEMAAMKRDAEHYSRQEHMELEKRYRELTDLLYYKQTQLEAMASEKSAAEFQLEKEVKRLKEAQVEAERSRTSRRGLASWEDDTDIKALEPLPLHHRHMAAAGIQLQKAAKLIDSGVVRATKFLWRYPTARVLLVFYLVFVHLFLMYLLHHLQEQADELASREVAQSMGLANPTLP